MTMGPISSQTPSVHSTTSSQNTSCAPQSVNCFGCTSELHSLAPNEQSYLQMLWAALCVPFVAIYQWLCVFFCLASPNIGNSSTTTPSEPIPPPAQNIGSDTNRAIDANVTRITIDPNAYPSPTAHDMHPNKFAAYTHLTAGRANLGGPAECIRYSQESYDIAQQPIFANSPNISHTSGVFSYPPSTASIEHWIANFADPRIFGFCESSLCAQDELQALEFPAAFHIRTGLRANRLSTMTTNEVFLLKNITRFGQLNGIYGNAFAAASSAHIISSLTRFADADLHPSNLFFIAAPNIPSSLHNQSYQATHLKQLFCTAYRAFIAIKHETDPSKTPVIHTGNWGAGAFGNSKKVSYLMQVAAAYCAGVDLTFYPIEAAGIAELNAAIALINTIRQQHPQMNVVQFLQHLQSHTAQYNLRYGISNNT